MSEDSSQLMDEYESVTHEHVIKILTFLLVLKKSIQDESTKSEISQVSVVVYELWAKYSSSESRNVELRNKLEALSKFCGVR